MQAEHESVKPPKANRLYKEKSPYLIQHALNPVDWFPWSEEAFAKAREENKPIFLSIGYSTCHWCHVMEEESFSNPEIAAVLNEGFVAIKVDREERPDIDQLYMQAVMAMTGSGGWPMSVFLTPEKKPFYGGTYFPPDDRGGRIGFKRLLILMRDKWDKERESVEVAATDLLSHMQSSARSSAEPSTPNRDVFPKYLSQLQQVFDPIFGGFGGAPKFPRPHQLNCLLRYAYRSGNESALQMVTKTLDEMASGGVWDHLAGGFHRYSTDERWQLPHFEKMLYDQALISRTYLEAYQVTGKEKYAEVAREILDFVLSDMTSFDGGFYSALDADSLDPKGSGEKKEGAYYVWSRQEIEGVLGPDLYPVFAFHFGLKDEGNVLRDPMHEFPGLNVLSIARSIQETAEVLELNQDEVQAKLKKARQKLLIVRKERPAPFLDDKILTDWNGLMIASLALGARVLSEPRYANSADAAFDFVRVKSRAKKNGLLHRYADGEAGIAGFVDDYATMALAAFDLYETTYEVHLLQFAKDTVKEMMARFYDPTTLSFRQTEDREDLPMDSRVFYDGALPSGNSLAVMALLREAHFFDNQANETMASEIFASRFHVMRKRPDSYPVMLEALDYHLYPRIEIVLSGELLDHETSDLEKVIRSVFLPGKVIIYRPADGEDLKTLVSLMPFVEKQKPLSEKLTVYFCKNHVCKLPTTDAVTLKEMLVNHK